VRPDGTPSPVDAGRHRSAVRATLRPIAAGVWAVLGWPTEYAAGYPTLAGPVRRKLWALTRRVFFAVRTASLAVGLFLAYLLGVGLTWLLTRPLPARWLGVRRRRRPSYWLDAEPAPGSAREQRLEEPF